MRDPAANFPVHFIFIFMDKCINMQLQIKIKRGFI